MQRIQKKIWGIHRQHGTSFLLGQSEYIWIATRQSIFRLHMCVSNYKWIYGNIILRKQIADQNISSTTLGTFINTK